MTKVRYKTIRALAFFYWPLVLVVACQGLTEQLKPAKHNEKWGYVNASGEFTIPPQYDSAYDFSEGLAAVQTNGRFGYINQQGKFEIQPKYFRAGQFKYGFAWVATRKPIWPLGKGEYGVGLFGQVTFIDRAGQEMRPSFLAEYVGDFSEGFAVVRPGKIAGGCSNKVGYMNAHGEWSIKPQFDEAEDFSDGLAAVNKGSKCHMGGKWGYVDKDGQEIVPLVYFYAGPFWSGKACVREEQGWKHGWKLIDTKGNEKLVEKDECLGWKGSEHHP